MKKTLGLILARGGSKGVPRKNIRLLNGKPLIAYAIEVGLSCSSIDRLIVSTDDLEIAEIAKKYGAEVPFLRPVELAEDHVSDKPVIEHALSWLKDNSKFIPDLVVNIRTTTPLKNASDITKAISLLNENEYDSVRTVTAVHGVFHPYWMYKNVNGIASPLIEGHDAVKYPNRQLLPKIYRLNGLVDVIKTKNLSDAKSMWGNRMGTLEVPDDRSLDIDTELDFKIVEYLMSINTSGGQNEF